MMRKAIFSNKKYILSSGREIDISAEHIGNVIIVTSMFNFLDPVQETGHAALIRIENSQTVSFESLSAKSIKDKNLTDVVKPIEGLNGADSLLKIYELNELISVMQQFVQKIDKELALKKV